MPSIHREDLSAHNYHEIQKIYDVAHHSILPVGRSVLRNARLSKNYVAYDVAPTKIYYKMVAIIWEREINQYVCLLVCYVYSVRLLRGRSMNSKAAGYPRFRLFNPNPPDFFYWGVRYRLKNQSASIDASGPAGFYTVSEHLNKKKSGGLGLNKRNRGYPADFEFIERPLNSRTLYT